MELVLDDGEKKAYKDFVKRNKKEMKVVIQQVKFLFDSEPETAIAFMIELGRVISKKYGKK